MMNQERDDSIEALLRKQFDGPIVDEGFSQRLMQRMPRRRRRVAWPSWIGIFSGAVACWLTLLFSPLLQVGWRDWVSGQWSPSAITMLLAMLGMAMLALAWGVTETGER